MCFFEVSDGFNMLELKNRVDCLHVLLDRDIEIAHSNAGCGAILDGLRASTAILEARHMIIGS